MPKYLISGKYRPETTAGVREAGYASRVEAARTGFESMGGTLESIWFTTGEWSVQVVVDLPIEAAFGYDSWAWATGTVERLAWQPLFTAAEADAAIAAKVDYTPPGS